MTTKLTERDEPEHFRVTDVSSGEPIYAELFIIMVVFIVDQVLVLDRSVHLINRDVLVVYEDLSGRNIFLYLS